MELPLQYGIDILTVLTIQKDRYHPTVYQDEYAMLAIDEYGVYDFAAEVSDTMETDRLQVVPKMDTEWIQDGYKMEPEDSIGLVKGSIKEKDKEKEKAAAGAVPAKKKFISPDREEVADYCRERNNNVDPDAFIDFYESKHWMIGKNKMSDWRAAVRTWERRQTDSPPTNRKNSFTDYPQRTYSEDTLRQMVVAKQREQRLI